MKIVGKINGAVAGISDSPKLGPPNSVAFERSLNIRTDPSSFTVNPQPIRQASGIIVDLILWWDLAGSNLYGYGNAGNIYLKDGSNNWSVDHVAPNSQGNGLVYFPEDGYLYYTQTTTIGRRIAATSLNQTYYDGFLETEGGAPTNTNSLTLVAASSQYASIASQASLQITLDLSMEAYLKMTSLPSGTQVQTIMSKWNQNGNQRSYKFDLTTSSNFFGNGQDGALTISSNTTESPIDSACSGVMGTQTLTATNVSFVAGQKILILQMQGTNAGRYQITSIQSYTAGSIMTADALSFTSDSTTAPNAAQVRVLPQYTNVTINTGMTYTAKSWNGTTGGILAFYANGTVNVQGSINAVGGSATNSTNPNPNNTSVIGSGGGFRGGSASGAGFNGYGYTGEGSAGASFQVSNSTNNGNGGGGGQHSNNSNNIGIGGGGGSNGGVGYRGASGQNPGGLAGNVTSSSDLTILTLGGGGGGGAGGGSNPSPEGAGGNGGGIISIFGATITVTGSIAADGGYGGLCVNAVGGGAQASGGAGSGGSILLKCQAGTFGTGLMTATGGWGSDHQNRSQFGDGYGGAGVIAVYYSSTLTGSSTPTLTSILDTTLSNTTGYVLRLLLSSTGSNSEMYSQDITNIVQIGKWQRYQVTWQASTSTANFYQNANLIGTKTGTFTSLFASSARFALGTSYDGAGAAQDFLNAQIDDVRLWNAVRNPGNLVIYNDQVMLGVETNLSAYYKFDGNANDSQTYTTNANLSTTNSPVFTTDVAFSGVTTRADQDLTNNAVGQTYALGTTLSESSTDKQTFVPTKEPMKSLQLNITTVGTGNWTVVIHDGLNRQVAALTVANATLHTGLYEFIFPSSFRPIRTATYHFHVYSTVADGLLVSSLANNMQNAGSNTGAFYNTFFQILVADVYHPMIQFQNFIAIGNERYVAKLQAGGVYNPHQLVLPAGYRVRCFAKWNEFLAIGVWKGTSITDTDQGKVFLWDGSSDVSNSSNANTIVDVLQGGVNAMQGAGGVLSVIAGYQGKFMNYGGISQSSYYSGGQLQKVTQLPLLDPSEFAEIAPGAMCMWQSIMRFGACINTNSVSVHPGIYSYGTLNSNYPISLAYDGPLSIGDTTSSQVKVGSLFPAGQTLYCGLQNGNKYGVDTISTTNSPYGSATCEYLITDLGKLYQLKPNLVFRVDFLPLLAGQSVTVKYKPDRSSTWIPIVTQSGVGTTDCTGPINNRSKEIQLALDIQTNGSQVRILGMNFEGDDSSESLGIS